LKSRLFSPPNCLFCILTYCLSMAYMIKRFIQTHVKLKGKISKRVVYQALIDKPFAHCCTAEIEKRTFHGQTYHNVTVQTEWESLVLNGKTYQVVRITLRQGTRPLFEKPMLLLTNRTIRNGSQAQEIYAAYLLRSKIEVVFRFLKQNLGWETFQVRDFKKIPNLLALAFFLVGFFPELEEQ
jgi:Transposase DDE domain